MQCVKRPNAGKQCSDCEDELHFFLPVVFLPFNINTYSKNTAEQNRCGEVVQEVIIGRQAELWPKQIRHQKYITTLHLKKREITLSQTVCYYEDKMSSNKCGSMTFCWHIFYTVSITFFTYRRKKFILSPD